MQTFSGLKKCLGCLLGSYIEVKSRLELEADTLLVLLEIECKKGKVLSKREMVSDRNERLNDCYASVRYDADADDFLNRVPSLHIPPYPLLASISRYLSLSSRFLIMTMVLKKRRPSTAEKC